MALKMDVSSPKGLASFNGLMTTKSYVEGFACSDADSEMFAKFSAAPDKATYPHAYRWFVHIAALKGVRSLNFGAAPSAAPAATPAPAAAAPKAAKAAAAPAPAPAAEEDEVDDLFGDDDEAEAPKPKETKSRKEMMEEAKQAKKPAKVERSQVVLEVKPWEAETDLVELFNKIIEVKIDGLVWGEAYKLVPVAFGVKKLVISCVVEDEKVGVEDITDAIEAFEDYVQSVDMNTMNRL